MRLRVFTCTVLVLLAFGAVPTVLAEEQVLIAYGGHNETVVPMWVGIQKGFFKKHGLDVRMLQVRSGQMIMSTLAAGSVQAVWPAPSSVLNAASGGMKISCVASGSNRIPRELVVQKEIKSVEDLRGKVFGVQSSGMWLRAMIVLENLGVDADKYQLKMRVIGDDAMVIQALITGNVDAAILPYGFSGLAKRAGLRSLADTAELKAPFQGSSLCIQRGTVESSPDLVMRLVRGIIEAVAFVLESSHKPEIAEILRKNLRFATAEDVDASYRVLQLMTTLDVAPNLDAWRTMQRVVARLNPKVGQVDLNQLLNGNFVRGLEENGFLPEMRKKLAR
jgi:ABC-type nitrate/sulfonate/bicarbonate transport system substrate-binding protein